MTQLQDRRRQRRHCFSWPRVPLSAPFILIMVVLAGCSEPPELEPLAAENYAAAFETAEMTPAVQKKWARSCALCHVRGEGGAPRVGDLQAWAPRVAGGDVRMMQHTVEGLNRMPPLGYCMDCDLDDFAAMIHLMTGRH